MYTGQTWRYRYTERRVAFIFNSATAREKERGRDEREQYGYDDDRHPSTSLCHDTRLEYARPCRFNARERSRPLSPRENDRDTGGNARGLLTIRSFTSYVSTLFI